MQLKVAVCDDEACIRDTLESKIHSIKSDYLIQKFSSGSELLEADEKFDIYFLDIEMPDINGMETAKIIREKDSLAHIIFLTGHTEFIRSAFKVRAYRYLLKPINPNELAEAIYAADKELLGNCKIAVRTSHETVLIDKNDIVCFEAFGDGTYIYTRSGVITSSLAMKYLLELVGNSFFQTHKSFAVSLQHVKNILQNEIEMNYISTTIPISRRKNAQFRKALFDFIRLNASSM